jgi:hypothetical protein
MGRREVRSHCDRVVVDASHVFAINAAFHGWASAVLGVSTSQSGSSWVVRKTRGLSRLPVDWLEAVLEVARGTELPLADNSPDGRTGDND